MEIPQELLSLVISMATVPTIRCSPNGAASMVASSLSSFIRDQLVLMSIRDHAEIGSQSVPAEPDEPSPLFSSFSIVMSI